MNNHARHKLDSDKTREELIAELQALRVEVNSLRQHHHITQVNQAEIALQQQFEQQRLLIKMQERIQKSLLLNDILNTTVEEVRQFLQTDRVIIFEFTENCNGTVVVESVAPQWKSILDKQIHDSCFGANVEAFKQGFVAAKSDIYAANIDSCHLELLANFQVRANLVVPILQADNLWGLLIAHHCTAPRLWQNTEIELLQQLATQVGIAIQQSNLFQQVQIELIERQRTENVLRQREEQLKQAKAELEQRVAQRTAELTVKEKILSDFLNAAAAAGIGIGIHDQHKRFLAVNHALADINGATINEHLGKTIYDVLPSMLASNVDSLFDQVITTEQPILNLEVQGETASQPGIPRDWLINFFPTFLEDGSVSGLGTVVFEITERKRAENLLYQRQQEFIALVENAPDIIARFDKDLRYLYINPAVEKELGIPAQAIIGTIYREEIKIVESDISIEAELRKTFATGKERRLEYRYRSPQGLKYYQARYVPEFGRDGSVESVLVVTQDITAIKNIQEALRHSEQEFRSLSESSPVGIFRTNANGEYTYTNPRYHDICNCTFEETLGNGWLNLLHPEDKASVIAKWTNAVSEHKHAKSEIRYVRKDGSVRYCQVQSAPVFDSHEKLLGHVGTLEDITESRAIAIMKNEFISIVSHELRTPLTSLRGSLELLKSGIYDKKPEKGKRMLQVAADSAARLVRLVSDILDLERLESGKYELTKERCNAATIMQQSVELMRGDAQQNNITLNVTPLEVEVYAACDAIVQIITNLLSNAVKFSEPGTTVWVDAKLQGEYVLFSVKDTGRGIPPDKLETIFGQFQQVDASDSRQKGGTGLGLAICRSIIQQHGCQIWAESILGEGSTFYFTLSLAKET
jgi:PAS domain S-box-containing protein